MSATLDRYVRHGLRFGVCPEFWQTAARDLDGGEVLRLARELGVALPRSLKTTGTSPIRANEPARSAAVTANGSRGLTEPSDRVSSSPTRPGYCADCGLALPMRNRTGYCRTCYQRRLMRARRANGAA